MPMICYCHTIVFLQGQKKYFYECKLQRHFSFMISYYTLFNYYIQYISAIDIITKMYMKNSA